MKKLITFLLLAGAVFGFGLTVSAGGPYNPGAAVTYAVTLANATNETANNTAINITISNAAGTQNTTQLITNDTGGNTSTYALASNAAAGTWTINATMAGNSSVTNSTTFTVNSNATFGNFSANQSAYNPGDTVLATLTVLDQSGANFTGNVSVTLYYDAVLNATNAVAIASGSGSTTFALSSYALNGSWKVNASFNGTGASFTVNATPRNPGISASSLSAEKNITVALVVSVTNNANFNDTFTVTPSYPANITSAANTSAVIAPNTSVNVTLYVTANASAGAGSYAINITVNSTANNAYGNSTSATLTVNPSHGFNISLNQTSATGTPGGSASFLLNMTNLGEASETYNITCSSNLNWTCTNTSITISNGSSGAVTISATVPQSTAQGTVSAFTVNVTSATYGSPFINQTAFNVTAGASTGASLNFFGTDASSTYWVKASTSRAFVLAINNTGNTAQNFTLNVTAGSWNLTVSSTDCSISSTAVPATNTTSFSCQNVTGLSSKNVSVTIAPPSNATPCTNTTIRFNLLNSSNGSAASGNITAKAPCFTATPVLTYIPTTGVLVVSITSVTREGTGIGSNTSSLTYSILSPAGANISSGSVNLSTNYNLNYSNSTTYPSNSNYTLSVSVVDNSSANYSSGALTYRFKVVRSITLSGTTTALTTLAGASYSNTVTSALDTGESVAPSVGGTCTTTSTSSPYIYSCTAPTVSTTYAVSSPTVSSCAYDANITCTISPALSSSFTVSVTITTLQQQQQQGGGGGGGGNATANVTQNLTAGASQSVNISMPATANITGAGNLTITISNLANVTQLINASLDELGDYSHFMLNISAPASIGAGENATFTVNITPYMYAKPGTYIVTVDVLGQKKNYTVTVPSPAYAPDTVNVNRYIETTRNRSSSVVYLELVNKKFESVNVTIRETIPKTLANSTAAVTFLTPYTTVVEDDPVVEWVLSLAPGETAEIRYTVKKDATNASFSEPTVTETLPPAVVPPAVEVVQQADNTWVLVLIGIVVIVGAVFAYLYFVERPLFYRIMAEARMKFEDMTKWLKK